MSFQDRLEITGTQVIHYMNGNLIRKYPLSDFTKAMSGLSNLHLPDVMPEGVKYFHQRGEFSIFAVEQLAAARSVRVIAENSPKAYGNGTTYNQRYLAFPYIIILGCFAGNTLTNFVQLFYRNQPLKSLNDKLYECNLPNVSYKGPSGLPYWFCTQYLRDVTHFSWYDKINEVPHHLWGSGFNWSSDHHEGLSMFNHCKKLDNRIKDFITWEKETRKDPYFMLKLNWNQTGWTVRQAIEKLFGYVVKQKEITDCSSLINLVKTEVGKKKFDVFDFF